MIFGQAVKREARVQAVDLVTADVGSEPAMTGQD